jgi:hypothetical protein
MCFDVDIVSDKGSGLPKFIVDFFMEHHCFAG